MFTAFMVVLCTIGLVGYCQLGYHLADRSLKIWKDKDNVSLLSLLFFPVAHAKGVVGDWDAPFVAWFGLDETAYKVFFAGLWPISLLINTPAILLYVVLKKMGVVVRKRDALSMQKRIDVDFLPTPEDDVQELFAKRTAVMDEIRALAEKKRAIDEELDRRKEEISAVFETEASVDAEVRELLEERVDKQHG